MFRQFDEQTLLKMWRTKRDNRILGELFKRYSHLVLAVCLKYLKNKEESQDAVMDIFEKLHEGLEKHEVVFFKSWLYMVAKNHCLTRLRKKGIQTSDYELSSYENAFAVTMETDEKQHDQEQQSKKLDFCIEQLKDAQKTCINLFFLQEKSYKEISNLTGFDFNAVKSHVQNGKTNLKKCVEG
jgi:RNA polymerase sigma factor (sigma-70 family)